MALEEYRQDMETCCRCSACKFIPFENVKGFLNVNVCPSIARYNFHAYSGGGRLSLGVAVLDKELDLSDKLLEVVYNCQMCGACDISCKYAMDMEVLEPINEMRIECVEQGRTLPVFEKMMGSLRTKGVIPAGANAGRKAWHDGLHVADYTKEKVDVVYHAGCRTRLDRQMRNVARSTVSLMQKAGAAVGIAGARESCCGGRAYEIGYKADFLKQAEKNMESIRASGARTLVTACAECYYAFKVLYDRFGLRGGLEVLHSTEYLARSIGEGTLTPKKKVGLRVTYHDPCHLGRLGEPYVHWHGKQIPGHIRLFDPPKEFRRGTFGVYEPPRDVLKAIPGLNLTEMDRIKEYAWCCGAGGGVRESNPEFASWTARERVKEAEATGVEAIVSACPGCEKSLREAVRDLNSRLDVYDVVELVERAIS
jgi:Fe-S oxidoreductase